MMTLNLYNLMRKGKKERAISGVCEWVLRKALLLRVTEIYEEKHFEM